MFDVVGVVLCWIMSYVKILELMLVDIGVFDLVIVDEVL